MQKKKSQQKEVQGVQHATTVEADAGCGHSVEPTVEEPKAKASMTPCMWAFVHGGSNSVPYIT